MQNEWYFDMDGKQGPIDARRLVDLKIDGLVTGDTLCSTGEKTEPYSAWEELVRLEAEILAERVISAAAVKSAPPSSAARGPAPESLTEMVRRIERKNRIVAGLTLLAASVLGLLLIFESTLMVFKLTSARGGEYKGATLGLRGIHCPKGACSRSSIDSTTLEEAGLEYRDKLPAIGLSTFRIAQQAAFYSTLLLCLLLLISSGLVLYSLVRAPALHLAARVNLVSMIPLAVLVLGMAVYLIGGMANLNEGIAHVDVHTNASLDGAMSPGTGLFIVAACLICTLTGYFYTHKLKHG